MTKEFRDGGLKIIDFEYLNGILNISRIEHHESF